MTNWAKNGKTPVNRLLAFQNPTGAFRFQDAQADDNQFATYQALPACAGKTYPLDPILDRAARARSHPGSYTPAYHRDTPTHRDAPTHANAHPR